MQPCSRPLRTSLATPAPNSPAGAARWYLDGGKPSVDSLYGAASWPCSLAPPVSRNISTIMRAFFDDVSGTYGTRNPASTIATRLTSANVTAHGRKVFWSRGNGWAFAGIARLLEYLPQNDPQRPKLIAIYQRMAAELIKRQSPDGFWRANLDDPEDVPNPESSGTGFFCFGLAWGINHHILDRRPIFPQQRTPMPRWPMQLARMEESSGASKSTPNPTPRSKAARTNT